MADRSHLTLSDVHKDAILRTLHDRSERRAAAERMVAASSSPTFPHGPGHMVARHSRAIRDAEYRERERNRDRAKLRPARDVIRDRDRTWHTALLPQAWQSSWRPRWPRGTTRISAGGSQSGQRTLRSGESGRPRSISRRCRYMRRLTRRACHQSLPPPYTLPARQWYSPRRCRPRRNRASRDTAADSAGSSSSATRGQKRGARINSSGGIRMQAPLVQYRQSMQYHNDKVSKHECTTRSYPV